MNSTSIDRPDMTSHAVRPTDLMRTQATKLPNPDELRKISGLPPVSEDLQNLFVGYADDLDDD